MQILPNISYGFGFSQKKIGGYSTLLAVRRIHLINLLAFLPSSLTFATRIAEIFLSEIPYTIQKDLCF
jgi:hypothetical protein